MGPKKWHSEFWGKMYKPAKECLKSRPTFCWSHIRTYVQEKVVWKIGWIINKLIDLKIHIFLYCRLYFWHSSSHFCLRKQPKQKYGKKGWKCQTFPGMLETTFHLTPLNPLSVRPSVCSSVRLFVRLAKSLLGPKGPSPPQELERSPL